MAFELDLTKPVGEIALTTPEGRIMYDLSAITKDQLELFQRMGNMDSSDVSEQVPQVVDALGSVLMPQNGGPPAGELLDRLYSENILGVVHIRQLADFVMDLAVGNPPA